MRHSGGCCFQVRLLHGGGGGAGGTCASHNRIEVILPEAEVMSHEEESQVVWGKWYDWSLVTMNIYWELVSNNGNGRRETDISR